MEPNDRKLEPKDRKLLVANALMWVLTGLYTASPIDLVPDLLPVLGWMDDGAGWLATIAFTVYTAWRLSRGGSRDRDEGASGDTASGIDGYEPLSLDEIRAL